MTKLKLFFVAFFALSLLNFNAVYAQYAQNKSPKRHFYKYHSKVEDPELAFLLNLLRGSSGPRRGRKIAVISRNLRFLSSILGKDVRIEAVKRRNINYIAHISYNSLKFRLWVINSQTSRAIDGLYRPKGLFEHKNGVFELVLASREVNLALKFVPEAGKYRIIMKYRQF